MLQPSELCFGLAILAKEDSPDQETREFLKFLLVFPQRNLLV